MYDIISAYPLLRSRQLERQKITMAMVLHGKNRHYHWHNLQPRHFISTAKQVGLSESLARDPFSDMMERVETAIEKVCAEMSTGFPDAIAGPIFEGMRNRRNLGMRGR